MDSITEKERLIIDYLNGDFSEAEEKELIQWVKQSQQNKEIFLKIKDTWDSTAKIRKQETEQLLLFYKKQAATKKRYKSSVWWSAAAILLLGLLIGEIFSHRFLNGPGQVESYYVPFGSHSELTLSDGTHIKLNADSRLEIGPSFSPANRTITLIGEGYFEVKSDKKHPFTIQTPKFDVLVTGTKFNLSSYSDDRKLSATLLEGKIQLKMSDDQIIHLQPGEKVSLDQKSMQYEVEQADMKTEFAWVNGEFIFREIPFPDLVKRLERWYDVKLKYHSDELNTMVYSGSFKNQETIWQVLDALKLTTPIDYRKSNFREFELSYQPMN